MTHSFKHVRPSNDDISNTIVLKLESVGGTARLMILKVDGAPAGRGRQVNFVLHQSFFVLSHPIAKNI